MMMCLSLVVVWWILLFLEFYLPSGILLAIAVPCAIVSLVWGFQLFGLAGGLLFALLFALGSGAVVWLALSIMRRSGGLFFLESDQAGFTGVDREESLVGKRGTALSDLGPAGFALIDCRRVPVLSRDVYIEKGSALLVVGSGGGYSIVTRLDRVTHGGTGNS